MWPIIFTLLVLGVLLLVVEVFVPGLIVGSLGVLALIAATVLTYSGYGVTAGNLLLLGELLGSIIFILWWLRYVPRSSFARRWTLHTTVTSTTGSSDTSHLLTAEGIALSSLRPSGIAEIGGHRLDVVTEGDLISKGDRVRVVKVEGNRVVVRRSDQQSEIST